MEFKKSIKKRRSNYNILKSITLSDERIVELIEDATKYTPSAFNSQSQMVVVLFGKNHDKLWDITMEELRKTVPADKFSATEEKINSFKIGYGTVLYFNDDSITKSLQEQYPLYADSFPAWAEQANGMLQFVIWNMLENEGLGANLQHYNPLIDNEIKTAFNISKNWRLIAQMPFGTPATTADSKEFANIHTRVKILR